MAEELIVAEALPMYSITVAESKARAMRTALANMMFMSYITKGSSESEIQFLLGSGVTIEDAMVDVQAAYDDMDSGPIDPT